MEQGTKPGKAGHCAVLLAAGGSARLGQPKQELTVEGEPLIRRIARLLAETNPRALYVVIGDPRLATHLRGVGARILENADWRSGLSSSVRTAASALAKHEGPTLFASVDQCRLTPAHLRALLVAGEAARDVVTRYDGEGFGIPALVTARTLAQARTLTGDRGFGQIWRNAPDSLTYIEAPELGFDLDTPAQLAAAIRKGWIDGHSQKLLGLRTLKQSRTRATLLAEAMRLFAGRGYDEVTTDEIASAAGVSRRTLFRYFPMKGDIILAWTDATTAILRETLDRSPPRERIGPALRRAFATLIERISPDETEARALVRFIGQAPIFRQHGTRLDTTWEETIAAACRARLPPGEDSPFAARILARVTLATFRAALDEWLRDDQGTPFPVWLERAFALHRHVADAPQSATITDM